MFDIVDLYCKIIIKPIENERNKLLRRIHSKNLFDVLLRNLYKEYLEKYENLLLSKYQNLESLINGKISFEKNRHYK